MRVPIREQLGLLILFSSLVGLCVVSVATWVSNHNFVLSIRSSRLSLTASLKAAQLASNLNLMQTSANFVSTRVLIQAALERYNTVGNNSAANWVNAAADMGDAISGGGSVGQQLLLQSVILPMNSKGPMGRYGLLNTTSSVVNNTLRLPYNCPDGSAVYLGPGYCGDLNWGYPPMLYPNLTYLTQYHNATFNISEAQYDGRTLTPTSGALLLGPMQLNDTTALVSMTMPLVNNTSAVDILGWLTVVMDAALIKQVIDSAEGLDDSGETLIVGPTTASNVFPADVAYNTRPSGTSAPSNISVQYVLPVQQQAGERHPLHNGTGSDEAFDAAQYPAVYQAFTQSNGQQDNAGAMIKTHNEAGKKVAAGYAIPQSNMVQWAVIVEQSRAEVWKPINRLRDILLACVFSTAALMAILAWPAAHFFSLPIRRLREATAKSIEAPGATPSRSSFDSFRSGVDGPHDPPAQDGEVADAVLARKEGYQNPVSKWRQKRVEERELRREARKKRAFKIPGKVRERKTCLKDELTDLTSTFNEMSDELMMQYERLEERVQQRTAELELSKKAAESANESKTLFIANISHELKTPLNGILGMCAVCMQEDDPIRLKRSLGIIYKSGDLLLNLLTDLLTFSKNQVGQHLTLDEKEFRLRDISSQVLAIFDKQAKEGQINLRVQWEGVHGLENDPTDEPERPQYGPAGTRLKNMILWGDVHRILQVIINLVSNALKFTPPGGSVVVTIRSLAEMPDISSRKGSFSSKQSRQRSSRHKGSDASLAVGKLDTANSINAKDRPHAMAHINVHERAPSPPPGQYLYFEFEVKDDGPGIPEDMQQRIFEPFVQADLGLSKKYGGTGLGLSICSQLADLMRGSMGVRSTLGRGSTFNMKIPIKHVQSRADSTASSTVDLPSEGKLSRSQSTEDGERTPARHSRHLLDDHDGSRVAPADGTSSASNTPNLATDSQPRLVGLSQPFFAASQPMESPGSQSAAMEKITAEATRGGKIRVLVAEDNKVNQEVVLRMLKLEDIYDVTVAKDGQEALDFVRESMHNPETPPYNLIFMDVQMPNVDGLTSTKMIREIGYQAPIVALTAFAEESNIKDCYDSGMNYFLSKPIRRPQLKKVLKEYCAPIPEENEEVTPPELATRRGSGGGNTTIVMVGGPSLDGPADLKTANGDASPAPLHRADTTEETRPVSPLSTT